MLRYTDTVETVTVINERKTHWGGREEEREGEEKSPDPNITPSSSPKKLMPPSSSVLSRKTKEPLRAQSWWKNHAAGLGPGLRLKTSTLQLAGSKKRSCLGRVTLLESQAAPTRWSWEKDVCERLRTNNSNKEFKEWGHQKEFHIRGSDLSHHRLDAHKGRGKDKKIREWRPALATWHLDGWKSRFGERIPWIKRRDSALPVTMGSDPLIHRK